jgi:hypothetical protein
MYLILYIEILKYKVVKMIVAYDTKKMWCLMQPPIKQIIILFKIWCGKLMSITLHLTCVILSSGVNMWSN